MEPPTRWLQYWIKDGMAQQEVRPSAARSGDQPTTGCALKPQVALCRTGLWRLRIRREHGQATDVPGQAPKVSVARDQADPGLPAAEGE